MMTLGGGGGWKDSHIKGVKKAVLFPLRVLSLKRFTAEAFAVLFRVLNRKKYDRKNSQATSTKQDLGTY